MAKAHEIHGWKENCAHRGQVQQLSLVDDSLGAGASIGLVFKTDTDTHTHVNFSVAAGADGRVMLYEDPTLTSCTLAAPCNMNRKKAGAVGTGTSFGSAPVFVKGSASVLYDQILPGGIGIAAIGGQFGGTEMDWILSSDTTYILSACNLAGTADVFGISAAFISHTA